MTVNPLAAGLLANQLVGEPITFTLVIGLIAVFAGIWVATTQRQHQPSSAASGTVPTEGVFETEDAH